VDHDDETREQGSNDRSQRVDVEVDFDSTGGPAGSVVNTDQMRRFVGSPETAWSPWIRTPDAGAPVSRPCRHEGC
jgi:hypothetical protein